ncbi:conserved hypothetical protein [Leishmania infantum JPCM5]|uniref:Uncharacterized protein n=3 Tax=Leishmania donovani species complex TaxID=38574 RepID=A4I909_LEIIN|nr:conserved hypothetical protein [Leishmania infantum JPCM5]XP_003863972.1 hypothetical protein, conserved [Leishmania donovani]CAC9531896.1 hypothetical_protein_-_conserved [Leishmania infantum]AYU82124.1 hypothetical protein LdCL_330021200 [Leishmania donovani]CAM71309.1 conserved hypothetical protein [Leishmania infantum JPCM5]CBZ37289.1 hypothetical protein, conserved [Leishmania donovani]SUZ45152.1 hypothetical_protein_-_conserved [Leishmania infantum]|eukprot:XP_001468228.1 conserved hypothetical protein [Leishmania infantum JPCM5]
MSIIYVDELAIRLPSDVRNTFNPLCAFGSSSNSGANPHNNNRCSAPVMGLREVQSGHVLLPIDAEGSIVVTPGQRYTVVLVRETRGGTVASAAAPPARAELSAASNGHQNSADSNTDKKIKSAAPAKPHQPHQQQQPVKKPGLPREASAAEPLAQPAMPPAQKANLSKKERKAARESAAEEHVYGGAAPSVSTVAQTEQPSKKRKRQDDGAAQAAQQQHRQKSSPTLNARVESADTDDAPLMAAYRSSQSHTSSRTSPVMEPSTSAESSRHNSKRGSLRSKTETVVAPPPPTRRSLSSIDGYDDEEGAQPLAQLYSAQSAASQPPVPEPKHAGEEETRITATSKKRRSPSEKTTKPTSASTAAPTAAPRVPSPPQPATCTAAEPATKTLRQKSASPDRVPVTLPPSSRTSTVRRVPLDTSSDSD